MIWIITYVIISFVISLSLFSFVFLTAKSSNLKRSFLVFNFFNIIWIGSNLLMILQSSNLFFRLVHGLGFFTSITALLWVLNLKNPHENISKLIIIPSYILASIIFGFCFYDELFFMSTALDVHNLQPSYGPYFFVFENTTSLILLMVLIYLFVNIFRTKEKTKRSQIILIFSGLLFYISATVIGLVLAENGRPEFGYLDTPSSIIFIAITAFTISKTKLMNMTLLINRLASYITTMTVFCLLNLAVIVSKISLVLKLLLILLITAVATAFGERLVQILITNIRRKFSKGWYDKEALLNELLSELNKKNNIETLLKSLLNILDERINFESISLLLANKDHGRKVKSYQLFKLMQNNTKSLEKLEINDPFFKNTTFNNGAIKVAEISFDAQQSLKSKGVKAELILPIRSFENLEGLLLIGSRSADIDYHKEDIDIFHTVIILTTVLINKLIPQEIIEKKYLEYKKIEHSKQIMDILNRKTQDILQGIQEYNHEIRTPLQAILSNAGLLPDITETVNLETVSKLKKRILENVERANDIVTSLFRVSGEESTSKISFESTNINDFIGQIKSEFKDMNILFDDDKKIRNTKLNKNDMFIVFRNIIINSQEADAKNIMISINNTDSYIYIDVKDDGKGIPSDMLTKIWEPFQTTHVTRGRGLGLTIAHRIISEHSGRIEAQSEENEGAKITILLPLC
jgi:signal transduction histidine kinase